VAETSGNSRELQSVVAATTSVVGEDSGEEEREVSEVEVDWVGMTDPDPSLSVSQPGRLSLANGPRPNCF
jgi:hypothetical protein